MHKTFKKELKPDGSLEGKADLSGVQSEEDRPMSEYWCFADASSPVLLDTIIYTVLKVVFKLQVKGRFGPGFII